jgi:hypothetical protein
MRFSIGPVVLAAAIGVHLDSAAAASQALWNDDRGGTELRLEFYKPLYQGGDRPFLVGAAFASAAIRVDRTTRLELELPMARATDPGFLGAPRSAVRVGNPYIGFTHHVAGSSSFASAGIRLPTAGEPEYRAERSALGVGVVSDFDRFEAFASSRLTLRAVDEWRWLRPGGLLLGLRTGVFSLWRTKEVDYEDVAEAYIEYGGRVGYQSDAVLAAVSLTGRMVVTEWELSLAEMTRHHLVGVVEVGGGRVRPSAMLRVPLDQDWQQLLDAIVGVGLRVAL